MEIEKKVYIKFEIEVKAQSAIFQPASIQLGEEGGEAKWRKWKRMEACTLMKRRESSLIMNFTVEKRRGPLLMLLC